MPGLKSSESSRRVIVPNVVIDQTYYPTSWKFVSLVKRRFDRLRVQRYYGIRCTGIKSETHYWLCRCSCGNYLVVNTNNLTTKHTRSCGCLASEVVTRRNTTHGEAKQRGREYRAWADMKSRCTNRNTKSWDDYGGRGIRICKRWFHSFEDFLVDMGRCPPGRSLDRRDVNGDYNASNCRWATAKEQARNTRRTRNLTLNGKTQCLSAWAEDLGICPTTLWERLSKWSLQRALTTPPLK
jgi:hypothetical protein